MNRIVLSSLAVILLGASFTTKANAQTMSQAGGGAQAYFGSQSNGYMDTSPFIGTFAAGAPSWTPLNPLPGVPAPPTPTVFPGPYPGTATSNPQNVGGFIAGFSDSLPTPTGTKATSVIADAFNPVPANTFDAQITIPAWRFAQDISASGYAWEQINFACDYFVNSTGLSGGTPAFPIFVAGTVSGGGTPFVQFDGRIEYSWIAANTTGTLSPPVSLGILDYSWSSGATSFSTSVPSSGSLLPTPSGTGYLELTGYLWVGGDPFNLVLSSNAAVVPEPTTFGLIGISSIALLRRKRR